MLSEKDKERHYWRFSIFLVLVSPLTVYALAKANYSFAFNAFVFSLACFLTMPLAWLVDSILIKLLVPASPLRFWVVKPTDEVRHLRSMPIQNGEVPFEGLLEKTFIRSIVNLINERLSGLGFETAVTEAAMGASVIQFRKAKRNAVLSFIDHSFFGDATVGWLGSAVEVRVRITFNDTLLLETGEFEHTRALCEYISLKTPQFSHQNVPLLVYCGLNLAIATTIIATVPYLNRYVGNLWLTCLTMGAVGMILGGLVLMQTREKGLFGYRLAFAGLYLASLPFMALIAKSLL